MKNRVALYIILIILIKSITYAQKSIEKRDYIWLMGYNNTASPTNYGTTVIDFNYYPLKIYQSAKNAKDDIGLANASICDKNGKLLLFTNGCHVEDSTFNIIKNSEGLNKGYALTYFCGKEALGYRVPNSHIFLPYPNDTNRYALFHVGADIYTKPKTKLVQWLSYSEINMSKNMGKPEMTIKNDTIVKDTVFHGQLTACRHGNGRDWWIIEPKEFSNLYYTILLSPKGLSKPTVQEIGGKFPIQASGGQANFTPDGTKYVRYTAGAGIQMFDFDRCTGKLINYKHIPAFTTNYQEGGNAISPNSRFLYVTKSTELWQFDLWANDISESRVLIAEKDTSFKTENSQEFKAFYNCMLGPDGKIYMCGTGGHRYWNVIHQPNEKGKACDFRQHDIKLPTWNFASIPNFPNYRLYDKKGSPCDTLGINDPLSTEEKEKILPHKIYPNPTTGFLNIEIAQSDYQNIEILVINSLGETILQEKVSNNQQSIDLYSLPNGTYFYKLEINGKVAGRGKILLIK
jgi:Secretion system C-terminal sorting domain